MTLRGELRQINYICNMHYPKILISCPTSDVKDYCVDDFITQIKTLTYPKYDMFILDNSKDAKHVEKFRSRGIKCTHEQFKGDFKKASGREELARHQNIIREYFLRSDCDYLLMIESDVFTGECIIETLLSHAEVYQSGIVTATYEIRKEEEDVLCLTSTVDSLGVRSEKLLTREHGYSVMGQGTIPLRQLLVDPDARITATGIGCTLFAREVMNNIPFRVNTDVSKTAYSDTYIFTDALKMGYEVLIASDIICEHRK
jgi:hypothetical protein